jgi:hypothetical protein
LAEHTADVITRENAVVDRPILDAAAAAMFRTAAVRLARERPETDGATEAAREAAQALLSLAASEDEAALEQFLRPDPRLSDTTWTVACYQIGDLTPCALLDFADPLAAVNRLAGCGEASHVAAELVASTPTGTRWTALTRTGKVVAFQLPDGRSASDATRERPGEVSLAGQHWRQQLNGWAAVNGGTRPPAPPAPPAPPVNRRLSPPRAVKIPAAPRAVTGPQPVVPAAGVDVEEALGLVVQALRSVEARSQTSGPANDEVVSRLDALDRRLSEFQATVEVALERRMQALGSYAAELTRAFAAQQSATTARLEARLDELMARIPAPARPGVIELPVGDDAT